MSLLAILLFIGTMALSLWATSRVRLSLLLASSGSTGADTAAAILRHQGISDVAAPLVQEAFERAVKLWSACSALHHSDRRVQYASSSFRELLNFYQVAP